MKRYFYSVLRYFLFYLLGFIAFYILNYLFDATNEFLAGVIPGLFKTYNPITSHDELAMQKARIALLSAAVSVLAVTVITVKHDNLRYEFLIGKTDGFYTVKEGFSIYISAFLGADILSALTVPFATVWLTLIKIPDTAPRALKVIFGYADNLLAIPNAFIAACGFIPAILALLTVSLLSRLPAALLGLLYWRGSWLSNTEH